MKLALFIATASLALASAAYAQDTNTLGQTANSGSQSTSNSGSSSNAIGGGIQKTNVDATSGSQSGAVSGSNSVSKGNSTAVNTSSTQNQMQGQTNGQTNSQASTSSNTNIFQGTHVPSTQTLYTAPQIVAPALSTTLTETCMGSGSGGISTPWGGVTGGKTYEDKQCIRRLNSRELAAQGFRVEACYVMMGDPEVAAAFQKSGRSCELAVPHVETMNPNIAAPEPAPPPPPPAAEQQPPQQPPVSQGYSAPPAERDLVQPSNDGERGAVQPNPEHQAVVQVPAPTLPPGVMLPIPNPTN